MSKKGKGLRIFYFILVLIVIAIAVWDSVPFNKELNSEPTQNTSNNSTEKNQLSNQSKSEKSTITDLVIKPIALNPINQIIFKVIFYLLALVSLFLLLPAGLATLKRFKLFNFEFELVEKVEVQQTITELVNIYEGKSNYIKELTKNETYQTIVDKFVDQSGNVKLTEAISWFLSDMKLNYQENFDQSLNWALLETNSDGTFTIVKNEVSGRFQLSENGKRLLDKALTEETIQTFNEPSNNKNIFKSVKLNLMIMPYKYEKKNYAIIVFNYKNGFDDLDESILESLYRIVRLSAEAIEYSILSKKLSKILKRNKLI
jgi:hypothetical protein